MYPDDADGEALKRLHADGNDMSRPMAIDFEIAAPDGPTAESIVAALAAAGYAGQSWYDEGESESSDESDEFGPSWNVTVTITMVPMYDDIIRIQNDLERVVGPHSGFSDGWGTFGNRGDGEA